jgi:hypothetical protein
MKYVIEAEDVAAHLAGESTNGAFEGTDVRPLPLTVDGDALILELSNGERFRLSVRKIGKARKAKGE